MPTRRRFLQSLAAAPLLRAAAPKQWRVYWGTYTEGGGNYGHGESKGIYVSSFNAQTGQLTDPELAAETPNPSWLTTHPNGRVLYAVNERVTTPDQIPEGQLSAFAINRQTGKLTLLTSVPSRGGQPCHITTDRTGHSAYAANWYTGSTAAFPLGKQGELLPSSAVSIHEGPTGQTHSHSVVVTPNNRFLLSTNTALNRIYIYRPGLTPHNPPFLQLKKPTNPRHLALHPNGKWAYVCNEITPGGCTQIQINTETGHLEEGPLTPTAPPDYTGRTTSAEVIVHPSGNFVYVSNRGPNSLAVLRVNPTDGTLTMVQSFLPGGETPRSFALDPAGHHLIAMMQKTGTIIPLRIDPQTGQLSPTGQTLKLPFPVCAHFAPHS